MDFDYFPALRSLDGFVHEDLVFRLPADREVLLRWGVELGVAMGPIVEPVAAIEWVVVAVVIDEVLIGVAEVDPWQRELLVAYGHRGGPFAKDVAARVLAGLQAFGIVFRSL